MKKNKRIRKNKISIILVILSNLLTIFLFIRMIVLQTDKSYHLYWLSYLIYIYAIGYYIKYWSKLGLNSDIDNSNVIERTFSDNSTTLFAYYSLGYLIILGLDLYEKLPNNIYIAVGFLINTAVYELFTMCLVYATNKDTAKLIKEKYNKKI